MSLLPPDFTLLQVLPALDAGGVEQTTLDVAEAVARAGGRALVAARSGRLSAALTARGGVLIDLPLDTKNPLRLTPNAEALATVIRREGVSLVHARSRAPAISALLAARRTAVPLVTTYHGVYNARSSLKRWYNSVMTTGAVTIANSDYTRRHILKEHGVDPDRVVSIPRGVDLRVFDPAQVTPERLAAARVRLQLGGGEGRLVVLLAGRLTRWKGQLLMIEAVRRLRLRRGEDAVALILAGDDQGRSSYSQELQAAIAGANLQGAVRSVGHVEDMAAAYLAADAAAAPSLEPEAFGRTAVEPQAMGRPILAADHGATAETVEEGVSGYRLRPGDADAWADGLERLLALTPEARAAMGQAGRARVRSSYSLEAMTDATLGVYRRVLEGAARK